MRLVTGQFSESFPPIMDGVGNVAKNYAYWLNKKYGKSYAITPGFPKYIDQEEFEVLRYGSLRIPTRPPYRTGIPQLDVFFMKKLRSIPFDIIHAHTPFSSGRIALDTARKKGVPIVATFHSKYYDDFLESFKIEGVARIGVSKIIEFYDSVDAVWTVNHSTADTLREYGFKGHIDVVSNGTEYQPSRHSALECDRVNHKLGLSSDELVFIYVGQMSWKKNTRALLESLALIKKKGIRFKMLMVGQGYALKELEDLAIELGIDDWVLFLGAILDREYLKALYCRADILLFPSMYDTFSIVVREAASQCCPALLVENSNAAEGITDGFNAFLCKDGAENIAQRVIEILQTPEQLKTVGENAHKTLYHGWEEIVDQVYERYCEIVNVFRKMHA